jgi:RNA polymerase sigma-70 factor (ECF subfamily)
MDFSLLLDRAKHGDAGALAELHGRYQPLVLARVRDGLHRGLRRHYDTLDLGQSVVVEVLRDLPDFEDRGEPAFRHWLYIKAENKVRAKLRKHNGRRGTRPPETNLTAASGAAALDDSPGPATAVDEADAESRLAAILAQLDDAHREVVLLRAAEGLSFHEVAVRLGLPGADAARKRYARALLALRERWTDA